MGRAGSLHNGFLLKGWKGCFQDGSAEASSGERVDASEASAAQGRGRLVLTGVGARGAVGGRLLRTPGRDQGDGGVDAYFLYCFDKGFRGGVNASLERVEKDWEPYSGPSQHTSVEAVRGLTF